MSNTSSICRSCRSKNLSTFLDLGKIPLADRFLTKRQLHQPESKYPLEVAFCSNCSLIQILEVGKNLIVPVPEPKIV